jgi:hypothetical protein
LMHSKNFGLALDTPHPYLGLDIHIRTKIIQNWSFVAGVAVKIGHDILDVGSFGHHYLNGIENAAATNKATLSGFPIKYNHGGEKQYQFVINMGDKGNIFIKVYGEYMAVSVSEAADEYFGDAVGLMGEFSK